MTAAASDTHIFAFIDQDDGSEASLDEEEEEGLDWDQLEEQAAK